MIDLVTYQYYQFSEIIGKTTNYYYVEKHVQNEPVDVNYKRESFILGISKMEREDIERFAKLENTVEQHDEKLDTLEDIARSIDKKLTSIEMELKSIGTEIKELKEEFKDFREKTGENFKEIKEEINELKNNVAVINNNFNWIRWIIPVVVGVLGSIASSIIAAFTILKFFLHQ